MQDDAIWEKASLLGYDPTKKAEADLLPWIRKCLEKVEFTETEYEKLVSRLGRAAAAEIVLLMVTRRCTSQDAKRLRCPWMIKSWAGLWKLQDAYNDRVAASPLTDESAVLSDSFQPKPEHQDDPEEGFCDEKGTLLQPRAEEEAPAPKLLIKQQKWSYQAPRKQGPYTPASGLRGHGRPATKQQNSSWENQMHASKSKAAAPHPRQYSKQPWSWQNQWQFKAGVPITPLMLNQAQIVIKSAQSTCKWTKKPMYWCEVEHNKSNLRWVYSCPCGQEPGLCDAHIFLNDSDIVQQGGDQPGGQSRYEVIRYWLWELGWSRVTSSPNQRFVCPKHKKAGFYY